MTDQSRGMQGDLFAVVSCPFCGGDWRTPEHAARCEAARPVLDAPAARAARDEAITRGEAHAAAWFTELAFHALERVAHARPALIVDDVWSELGTAATTHEKRAMGGVMQRGHREGLICPTSDFRASAQPQCHANPRRVWASRVFRPGAGR